MEAIGKVGKIVGKMSINVRRQQANRLLAYTTPDFRLNFLQVILSTDRFSAGVLPFESRDQLRTVRAKYAASHVVQRDGSEVVCIPLSADAPLLGTPRTYTTDEAPHLVRKLLQEALLRFLKENNYRVIDFDPPTFVLRHSKHDLLSRAVEASEAALLQWLHVYQQYTLAPRLLYPRAGPPLLGIQVDCRTRREIDCSVDKLMELGLDVRGYYVLARRPNRQAMNPLRDPVTSLRLTGRIYRVDGNRLLLEDTTGINEVRADQAWLEASYENMEECLRLASLPDVSGVMRRLETLAFHLTGANGRLKRLGEITRWLQQKGTLPLAAGLSCTVGEPLKPRQGVDAGMYRKFPAPEFVFDPARNKTDRWHDRGLEEYGPFDTESFSVKRPHIVVVTPQDFKGDVEVFLRKFRNGIPRAKTFTQGFVRKYHLNDCSFRFEAFDRGSREAASYRQACLQALHTGPKPDLAFVIIQDQHKLLHGDDNPYLVSKSAFMSQGVPVQEVKIETIRVPPELEYGIPYTLNNIGLACYAKLGGIPFVMAAVPGLAHELVIGIGSATLRQGRLSGEQRVVGITTVFSADGNYLLYNNSREVDFDDYPDELLNTLRTAIEQVRVRNAWQPGDAVRLVFHVFKPLRDVEARAVKRVVEQLADFEVEFAFLHISEEHGWVLFDRNSAGVQERQTTKGECVPERGYAVPLDRSEILLSVTGPRQLKTPLQGAPRPLLLRLHRESTFQDLEYLAGQVFRFTALSWRSFFPSRLPVTILYSDRIASLLGQLRQVKNWNPDMLATALRGSRWFL